MNESLTIAVVIPCRNEAKHLPQLLQALATQQLRPTEIVLVDSNSDDQSPAVAAQAAQQHGLTLHCLPNPKRSIPYALNLAIQHSTAAVIVRLDGHSIPAPDYIARCVAGLQQSEASVVGGRWQIVAGARGWLAQGIALAVSTPFAAGDASYRTVRSGTPQWVETVPFGCFYKTTWVQVGGYNEALLANEDYEFYQRIRAVGGKILFDPAICCTYFARSTLRALAQQYGRYGWWKAQMLKQYPGSARLRQLIPPLWVLLVVLMPLLAALSGLAILGWFAAGLWLLYLMLGLFDITRRAATPKQPTVIVSALLAAILIHFCWGYGFWLGLLQKPKTA